MNAHRFVLPDTQVRERVDKVLSALLPGTSRANLQRWILAGQVVVDGRACRSSDRVGAGQVIEVTPIAPPPSRAAPDEDVVFDVIYEDDHLLVIDKPAGLVVHPARGHSDGTLVNGLLARYGWEWSELGEADEAAIVRPGIVHRIDKDTSGILVVARNEAAREGLKAQLASHQMGRRYLGLSIGVPRVKTIRTFYGRHPKSRIKWSSLVREGKPAATHVRVVEVLANSAAALIECRLETGRTHQIRVHLAEQARTPLLADALYGRRSESPNIIEAERLVGRQALHAAELSFVHPVTGQSFAFESKLPADFSAALEYLRGIPES
ncbi:MAG TPA: RluA family pseudouridine synthase [Polyangiaceae bacterium]